MKRYIRQVKRRNNFWKDAFGNWKDTIIGEKMLSAIRTDAIFGWQVLSETWQMQSSVDRWLPTTDRCFPKVNRWSSLMNRCRYFWTDTFIKWTDALKWWTAGNIGEQARNRAYLKNLFSKQPKSDKSPSNVLIFLRIRLKITFALRLSFFWNFAVIAACISPVNKLLLKAISIISKHSKINLWKHLSISVFLSVWCWFSRCCFRQRF